MSDTDDDRFVKGLKRQPLRPVPASWKSEILGAARAARATRAPESIPANSLENSSHPRKGSKVRSALPWVEWFWPHPVAWAGLAAVWVLILGVNLTTSQPADNRPLTVVVPSREVQMALAENRRMLEELLGLDTAWNGLVAKPKEAKPRDPVDVRPRSALIPNFIRV